MKLKFGIIIIFLLFLLIIVSGCFEDGDKLEFDENKIDLKNYDVGPSSIITADIDGDSDLDLIGTHDDCVVIVLFNGGKGKFRNQNEYYIGNGTGMYSGTAERTTQVFAHDLDLDGDNDLIVGNWYSANASNKYVFDRDFRFTILFNNGDGRFDTKDNYTITNSKDAPYDLFNEYNTAQLFVLDMDDDNDMDIIVQNWSKIYENKKYVTIFLNNGMGKFNEQIQSIVDYQIGLFVELNNDGLIDLVSVGRRDESITTYLNEGSNVFNKNSKYSDIIPIGLNSGYLNNDKYIDLVVSNPFGNEIIILINNGKGEFNNIKRYAAGKNPYGNYIADINGDGNNDVMVINDPYSGTGSISILLNNGDGSFSNEYDYEIGYLPNDVIVSDLNSDGDNDIIGSDEYGLKLLENKEPAFQKTFLYFLILIILISLIIIIIYLLKRKKNKSIKSKNENDQEV